MNSVLRLIVVFAFWFLYFAEVAPKTGIPAPFSWLVAVVVVLAGLWFTFEGPKLISKYE